jgi:hypothetical protein
MVRQHFDSNWSNLTFSNQPEQRPDDISSETFWWQLVNNFVQKFNMHREQQFISLDQLCVDGSMARWYENVGIGLNMGNSNILQLITNQRLAVRSRIQHVVTAGLCYGPSWLEWQS